MKGLRWFDQSTLVVWRKHLSACPFSLASRPFLLGIPAPCLWETSPLSSKEKRPFFGRPHAFPWEGGTLPLGEVALFTACAALALCRRERGTLGGLPDGRPARPPAATRPVPPLGEGPHAPTSGRFMVKYLHAWDSPGNSDPCGARVRRGACARPRPARLDEAPASPAIRRARAGSAANADG